MRSLLITLLITLNCSCMADEKDTIALDVWFTKTQRIDEEAVQWLKGHLKERLANENLFTNPLREDLKDHSSKECQTCGSENLSLDESSTLYVFMSFSLEDQLWVQFSQELERVGGVFVVRGLPQNSFKELANRIFDLQKKGVNAPIQIHPILFRECDVLLVPTIAVVDGNRYDKISGNLSIKHALEKMSAHGETNEAKVLYRKYWEKP